MKLFFGRGKDRPVTLATHVRDYLSEDRRHHYRDGYSMAEAAKCWVLADGAVPSTVAAIIGSDELASAHFEFPTKVWGGGMSMTDVMAFLPRSVVAVEAKAIEPFDELVADWIINRAIVDPTSPSRRERIIERYASEFGVEPKRLLGIRYQLLHRTLSAARTARAGGHSEAWMIVQSFAPRDGDAHRTNREDFARFQGLVGATPKIEGISVQTAWTDAA